jgi:hypothetical protein
MNHTLIMSSHAVRVVRDHGTTIVGTPLDAIQCLEASRTTSRVILDGTFARNDTLAATLHELYPAVRIVREGEPCCG